MRKLESLVSERISRRELLKRAGKASAFLAAASVIPGEFYDRLGTPESKGDSGQVFFNPIDPSDKDELILPEGFSYTIIRKWGDKITEGEDYGFNNDYTQYLPIDLPVGGNNSEDGLLFVNHEYPSPLFINNYTAEDFRNGRVKTPEEVSREKRSVGFSIFRVKKIEGEWKFVEDDLYNRRVDADTPVHISGEAAASPLMGTSGFARGTLANCSGGLTPWGTVLSAEENFQDYYSSEYPDFYRWNDVEKDHNIHHYGWVVEVDPFDKGSVPVKRTSLGRFRHENVAIAIGNSGKVVAYMGDDKVNECVYKFVSKKQFDGSERKNNFGILDEGDLYVADFENGRWILLDHSLNDALKKEFTSQAEVLINCDKAAKLAGGTECNRPEDIEISPVDGSLFVTFTNNSKKDDYFGSIVRMVEKGNDPESSEFTWEVFATGGAAAGFSCPDNLNFDREGNLWVLCDVSEKRLNKDEQKPFKNNSLFMFPTTGEHKGKAFRFAAGPADCEMCGANFTPDGSTLFLSIQHPGENSLTQKEPTSRWPDHGNDIPRPAVVAITGFKKRG